MKWDRIGIVLILVALGLSGCSFQKTEENTQLQNGEQIADEPGIYDSADTAVIVGIDKEAQTITLKNLMGQPVFMININRRCHLIRCPMGTS
jgi:hypothetical protein